MSVKLITVLILWAMVTSVVASEELFENSDFEAGTWKNWMVEGEAFEGRLCPNQIQLVRWQKC